MMHRFEPVQSWVWAGGLLGLIPFYGSLWPIYAGIWEVDVFLLYSAIILSFLCGQVWRQVLIGLSEQGVGSGILIALAVPAVLWLVFFAGSLGQLIAGLVGYLLVYGWERRYCWQDYPSGYRVLRTALTTLVVLAHLVLLGAV